MNGFSWARVRSLERSMWRWRWCMCMWRILQARITVKYIMKPCHTETVETWVEGGEWHESRKTCNRKYSESSQPLVIGLLSLCWSKTLLLERAVCPPCSSGFVIPLLLLLLVIMKLRGGLDYLIDLSESKLAKSGVWQVVSLARKWCVCTDNIMQELKCREKSGIVAI